MTARPTRLAAALVVAFAAVAGAQAAPVSADHAAVQRALAHVQASGLAHSVVGEAFAARDLVTDADGATHVRFHRTHQGLRVIGGDFVVHLDAAGGLKGVSHAMKSAVALATVVPTLSDASAHQRAMARFGGLADSVKAELVVYARDRAPVLAYDVRVSGTIAGGLPSIQHLIIGAHDGAVLDRWDDIQTVDSVGTGVSLYSGTVPLHSDFKNGTYTLTDATRGGHTVYDLKNKNGQFTNATGTVYTDADNVWGDGLRSKTATSDAVDAAYGQNTTWDFFKTTFGRNGIADDGRGAYSRVHSKTGALWYNAFWSDACFCMTYTSGMSASSPALISLDVAGHEMTHGVTANSAGLVYSKESGGLNEGTSDIMGTMVEWFANNPNDTPDFTMGERMGAPLRVMYQPNKDGKSADCWYPTVGSLDVHYSSGVANHVFYLMAEGTNPTDGQPASKACKAGDTKTATGTQVLAGIGRTKAQAIWYRALTVYFTSTTDYHAARTATLAAAADLYGAGSATWNAVAAAWSGVNVN